MIHVGKTATLALLVMTAVLASGNSDWWVPCGFLVGCLIGCFLYEAA